MTYKDQLGYGLHVIVVMAVFFAIGYAAATRLSEKTSMVRAETCRVSCL